MCSEQTQCEDPVGALPRTSRSVCLVQLGAGAELHFTESREMCWEVKVQLQADVLVCTGHEQHC